MSIQTTCSRPRAALMTTLASYCLLHCAQVFAWQQEYASDEPSNGLRDRYTWDNERPPSYNDILAERILSSQSRGSREGLMFAAGSDGLNADASRMGIGWNIPVAGNVTTGPTAGYRWDGSPSGIYNEYGDSAVASRFNDPLWHASVSSVGWRLDSSLGSLRPWAQVSYNHQYGDNVWKAQSGLQTNAVSGQDSSWMDVTVGADMPIGNHVAAFASLSQAEGLSDGETYLYHLGVSAKF